MKLARAIAAAIAAQNNCAATGNREWYTRHSARLVKLCTLLPSGSGFDSGTIFDGRSTPEKLIFRTSFHHMEEHGSYSGWTDHTVTVRASLYPEMILTISGRNRNGIKELIHETFYSALMADVPEISLRYGMPATDAKDGE